MDRLDKFNITIIALISLITIGMLANQEIIKRRQGNHEAAAAEKARYYAEQMALNAKIYQEVISLMELEHYDEAMTKLQEVMKTYPGKAQSYVYLAQLSFNTGKLSDTIHNYRLAVEKGHSVITSDLLDEAMDRYMPKASANATARLAEALVLDLEDLDVGVLAHAG